VTNFETIRVSAIYCYGYLIGNLFYFCFIDNDYDIDVKIRITILLIREKDLH
jgi:hypothetical protein